MAEISGNDRAYQAFVNRRERRQQKGDDQRENNPKVLDLEQLRAKPDNAGDVSKSVRRHWGLSILVFGLIGVALTTNGYYSWQRGDTLLAACLWVALGVLSEAIAVFLPNRAVNLHRAGYRGISAFAWLLFCPFFFFAITNSFGFLATSLSEVTQSREERVSPEVALLQRKLDAATRGKEAECSKRGDLCRGKEKEEREAFNELQSAMGKVKTEARVSSTHTASPAWLWLIAFMLQSSPIILLIAGDRK